MSFFRFLLALLIAAGIAFGLYLAVDKTRLDRVVEAVRTEVIDPVRARLAPDAAETGDEAETVQEAGTEAEAGSDMTIAPITPMPDTMEAVLPDDAQAPAALETQAALLPTTRIEASESVATDSTDALTVVSGGMSYAEARETMIASGWQPRIPALRAEVPDSTESALIEAGYAELEGCDESERPLCRFEFVDGQKRIAAVITRGTGTDPSVADAYLMNIRAE